MNKVRPESYYREIVSSIIRDLEDVDYDASYLSGALKSAGILTVYILLRRDIEAAPEKFRFVLGRLQNLENDFFDEGYKLYRTGKSIDLKRSIQQREH